MIARANLRAGQPFGQGAGQHPRDLSARRAVPDRRRRAVRDRAGDPASAGAPDASGCSSGATPSPASSPAWSTCRASATTPSCGANSRTSCCEALNGTEVEFQAQLSESILARIQFIVRTPDGIPAGRRSAARSRRRLVEAARSWTDVLRDALIDAHGEEEGNRLLSRLRRRRSRSPIRSRCRRAPRSPDIDRHRPAGQRRDRARDVALPRARARRRPALLQALPRRLRASPCPTSCRCSRTWACGSSTSGPTSS